MQVVVMGSGGTGGGCHTTPFPADVVAATVSGVSVSCPACRAPIVAGALRCKLCGADARGAAPSRGAGAAFTLASVSPRAARAVELLDEFSELAPEVLAWWRKADEPGRGRLLEILGELRALLRK
jgi:hypothetical protein